MLLVPAFGVLSSLFLIWQLPWETWARLGVWLLIGFAIYFAYGCQHSLLNPDSPHHDPSRPQPPDGRGVIGGGHARPQGLCAPVGSR